MNTEPQIKVLHDALIEIMCIRPPHPSEFQDPWDICQDLDTKLMRVLHIAGNAIDKARSLN